MSVTVLNRKSLFAAAAAAAMLVVGGKTLAEDFSNPAVNQYWGTSWTDSGAAYHSPDQTKNSVAGGQLITVIPTDGTLAAPDNEVTNFIRTRADLPGASAFYSGQLLGNLSGQASISATMSLNNSTVAPGAQFQTSQFVGEGTGAGNSGAPTPSVRFVFTGNQTVNANGAGDMEPNIWWSNAASLSGTSMNNGQNYSITAAFDPSQWTNIDGLSGNSPAVAGQFQLALTDVSLTGISFGSGFFYSNGFGVNTGGAASLNLDSIGTTPAPEPTSLALLGLGALPMLRRRRS
jgi:MYXO-CTERM domain-containing protein